MDDPRIVGMTETEISCLVEYSRNVVRRLAQHRKMCVEPEIEDRLGALLAQSLQARTDPWKAQTGIEVERAGSSEKVRVWITESLEVLFDALAKKAVSVVGKDDIEIILREQGEKAFPFRETVELE